MIYKCNFDQMMQKVKEMKEDPNAEGILYGIHDREIITYGNECDCNVNYARAMDVPAYNIGRGGGCIVHSIGDIGGICITKGMDFFLARLVDYLIGKLREIGIQAYNNHNDIIIPNYHKVMGVATEDFDKERLMNTFHISINCDLKTILLVCRKTSYKIPSGLIKYGVTTEMVEQ